MKDSIDIRTQPYFPYHMVILGIVFLLMAVFVSLMEPLISVILFILGILFITTHYRLRIDLQKKKYRDYLWLFGFKIGRSEVLQRIEYIYLNKLRRETEYGFVARLTSSNIYYQGYIKISNDEPLFIGESKKEDKILEKSKKLSVALDVELVKNY